MESASESERARLCSGTPRHIHSWIGSWHASRNCPWDSTVQIIWSIKILMIAMLRLLSNRLSSTQLQHRSEDSQTRHPTFTSMPTPSPACAIINHHYPGTLRRQAIKVFFHPPYKNHPTFQKILLSQVLLLAFVQHMRPTTKPLQPTQLAFFS